MRTSLIGLLVVFTLGCGPSDDHDAGTDVPHATDVTDVSNTDVSNTDATTSDTTDVVTPTDQPAVDVTNDTGTDSAVADTGTDSAVTDAPTTGDACARPTTPATSINTTCTPAASTCPTGYTCQSHAGIVAMFSCEIVCTTDCDCPATTACQAVSDKGGVHHECH